MPSAGDVPDEAYVPDGHGVRGDYRAGHRGMTCQRRFDVSQFDAEPADLHLVVGAAQKLDVSVRSPPDHVPGAVHPGSRGTPWIGHEPLCGQARAAQIATCHTGAAHVQLALHPDRDRTQPFVEDVEAIARLPGADRHLAGRQPLPRFDPVFGTGHRDLGGAVEVVGPEPGTPAPRQLQCLRGERLTAEHQVVGGHEHRRQGVEQGQVARGHQEHGAGVFRQPRLQPRVVLQRCEEEAAAHGQRCEQGRAGDVEGN